MNIGIIIIIAIIFLIFGLIHKLSNHNTENEHNNDLTESGEVLPDDSKYMDCTEMYFSEIKNGQKPFKFINIYDQSDLMLIKSLLQAEGIPYYIMNEYSSKVHPAIQISTNIIRNLNILERDYEIVAKIIQEYEQNKDKIMSGKK